MVVWSYQEPEKRCPFSAINGRATSFHLAHQQTHPKVIYPFPMNLSAQDCANIGNNTMVFRKRTMTGSPIQTNDEHDIEVVFPLQHEISSDSTDDESPAQPTCFCDSPIRKPEPLVSRTANPQSPSEQDLSVLKGSLPLAYGDHHSQRSRPNLFLIGFTMVAMAAVILSRNSVNFVSNQVTTLMANRDHLNDKLRKTTRDLHMLKRELSAVDLLMEDEAQTDSTGSPEDGNHQLQLNELNALQTRIKGLEKKSADMKLLVQTTSRQQMLEKYGGGVKQVEMELVFPDGKDGPTKFVIAVDDNLMPHSSFTFLEMVSSGLMDGCSFILNALHVLKAAPLPYDGSSAAAKARAFTEMGLESVAFKEYSDSFPHTKYTVGFAADGSPSFFINTEDNTEIHVGDPCFGRIIEGFDTVKRLEASPTRNGIWFAKRIGIKKARVL